MWRKEKEHENEIAIPHVCERHEWIGKQEGVGGNPGGLQILKSALKAIQKILIQKLQVEEQDTVYQQNHAAKWGQETGPGKEKQDAGQVHVERDVYEKHKRVKK